MNYLLPYHRIIYTVAILIFSVSLGLAQIGDSLPRPAQPLVSQVKIATLTKDDTSTPDDISKSALASYYKYEPTIQKENIERKYFTDNAFDIGAYDNPFALQGAKSPKNRINKSKTKNTERVFSDLFAVNTTDSKQKIPKWLVFVLLGIVSFMTILITLYRKTVGNIFQAFFSLGAASNLYREQRSFLKIESFSSYLLFVLSMGTFCFVLPQFLAEEAPFNTFGGLLLCMLGVGSVYVLKHIQLQVVGLLLPYGNEIGFYSFIVSITNKIIGYFLVPALFLLAYAPEDSQIYVLYFILSLLGLIYIYRSIRGLGIGANTILFHKFHFFVYLCSVEIAPVIILLKLLSIF